MAFALPLLPRSAEATVRLLSYGADLSSTTGGPSQRVNRLGSRMAVEVQLPTLDGDCGRQWAAALARAEHEPAILRMPQPGLLIGDPGANVQVNGGGQAGRRLSVRNMTAGHQIKAGRLFHLFLSGRHYLHQVTSAAIVNGSGQALLDIAPMLRVSSLNGDHVNFLHVNIEGWISLGSAAWSSRGRRFLNGQTFTITEAE